MAAVADRVNQEAQAVQDHQERAAFVANDGDGQREFVKKCAHHQQHHSAHGKSEVLPNDGAGATGKAVRGGKLGHLLGEKRHIGGLQRDLAARGPHRDAKIGAGQCGGVIHPIADKGHPPFGRQIRQ